MQQVLFNKDVSINIILIHIYLKKTVREVVFH